MKRTHKLRDVALIVTLLLVLSALVSCGTTPPPPLEEVKDELVALIDASAEINTVFFGSGLDVYDREGTDEEKLFYEGLSDSLSGYEMVRPDAKYLSVDAIKEAAGKVYSASYLEGIYQMVFDGYADEIAGVTRAKFLEWEGGFYQNSSYESYIEENRTYNYDTMKIVDPSRGEYLNVELESELGGEKLTVILSFTLTGDGWRLDSPTY